MLRERIQDGLKWLSYDLFEQMPLFAASFTRHGGASLQNYASLNLSDDVGDDPFHVAQNLERLQAQVRAYQMIFSKQSHQANIHVATAFSPPKVEGYDAFVTSEPHLALVIKQADCQAALIYDPIQHVAAAVHAGWRGSCLNIYGQVIDFLKLKFGCNASDLLVAISPSLGPQKAEFIHYERELLPSFWPFQVKPGFFDFWQISRWQLEEKGILPEHLTIAQICTYSHSGDYFSYRRDPQSGRQVSLIMLKAI